MNSFGDRERGFEAKYSFDLEQDFRVEAHLYKMLATWAGEKMGMSADERQAYATKTVGEVVANPKDNDIVSLLLADFERKNVEMTEAALKEKLEELRPTAREDLLGK